MNDLSPLASVALMSADKVEVLNAIEAAPSDYKVRALDHEALLRHQRWSAEFCAANVAEELSESLRGQIGTQVMEEYQIDEISRDTWLKKTEKGLKLAQQEATAKTDPWPNCSNVIFPLIGQAAMQFAARAYPAIIQNRSVVKSAIIGEDAGVPKLDPAGAPVMNPQTGAPVFQEGKEPGAKAARGMRVSRHMSYQLLEEMPEWEDETDKLLHKLSIVGSEFRKTFRDHRNRLCKSVRLPAKDVVVNYKARHITTAPRVSEQMEKYPYEIRELVASGEWLPGPYSADNASGQDSQAPIQFIEQHRRLDLDGDGYPEPYIVWVHRNSSSVCRIQANYEFDQLKIDPATGTVLSIPAIAFYTHYQFLPSFDDGFYGMGWGTLLVNINEAINSTLNMIFDAGALQNTGGGFVGKGLSLHGGAMQFKLGEWKMVNVPGQSVRENIVPLQHQGPSAALFSLLTILIDAGKDLSAIKDILTGELRAQTMSPSVFSAIVEQGLKVFTAIYKRIYKAEKAELEKLHRLNRLHLPETKTTYQPSWSQDTMEITREDYDLASGVEPVADPNMVVDAQRMAHSQLLEAFKDDPMCDGREIRRRMFEAAGIEKAEILLTGKPAPNPQLAIETMKLNLERPVKQAQVLELVSRAIKNLAEADAKVVEPFMAWMNESIKGVSDAAGIKQGSNGSPPAPSGAEGDQAIPA